MTSEEDDSDVAPGLFAKGNHIYIPSEPDAIILPHPYSSFPHVTSRAVSNLRCYIKTNEGVDGRGKRGNIEMTRLVESELHPYIPYLASRIRRERACTIPFLKFLNSR